MIFQELTLAGVFLLTFEKHHDERGFFARTFCKKEFEAHNLHTDFKQESLSFNKKAGTVRGLHYQHPHPEIKIVQCLQGEIYDVLVDLRKDSPTYGSWIAVSLKGDASTALYIPAEIAHGFQTIQDDTLLFYKISEYYEPTAAQGVRWDDSALAIAWPLPLSCISARDRSYPDLTRK